MSDEIDVRITSDPKWLGLVRVVVEQCCHCFGVDVDAAKAMVVAVNEAVSNVMRHAYEGDTTQPIRIVCRRDGGVVEVRICDYGKESDLLAQPIGPPEELRTGGRGLFIMRSLMDEVDFVREDGCNRLSMRKHLPLPVSGR